LGGALSGSFAVVDEFSTLHFRSSLRPGCVMIVGRCGRCGRGWRGNFLVTF
jgi:hypothetical protein